jgi:predicted transcriptional regulator
MAPPLNVLNRKKVKEYLEENGPSTRNEIHEGINVPKTTIYEALKALGAKTRDMHTGKKGKPHVYFALPAQEFPSYENFENPNKILIRNYLSENGPSTRDEIRRDTKLSRTTIYDNLPEDVLVYSELNLAGSGRPFVYFALPFQVICKEEEKKEISLKDIAESFGVKPGAIYRSFPRTFSERDSGKIYLKLLHE